MSNSGDRNSFLKLAAATIGAIAFGGGLYVTQRYAQRAVYLDQLGVDNDDTQELSTIQVKEEELAQATQVPSESSSEVISNKDEYADINAENFYLSPFNPSKPFKVLAPEQTVPGYGSIEIDIDEPMPMENYGSDEDKEKRLINANFYDHPKSALIYLARDVPTANTPGTLTSYVVFAHSGRIDGNNLPAQTFREWFKYYKVEKGEIFDKSMLIGKSLQIEQEQEDGAIRTFDMIVTGTTIVTDKDARDALKNKGTNKPAFKPIELLHIPPASQEGALCISFEYCMEEFELDSNGQPIVGMYDLIKGKPGTLGNWRGILTLEMQSWS